MQTKKRFPDEVYTALKKSKSIRVRAGRAHRFSGIWFVLVEDRVLARSWSVKPDGWYHAFLKEPRGAIQVRKAEIPVCAQPIRTKRLKDAADRAYLKKYCTAWELRYAKDLMQEKSRATTIEFLPSES